jgi:hypothetical protein
MPRPPKCPPPFQLTKTAHALLISMRAACPAPSHLLLITASNNILKRVQIMKLLIMQFSPYSGVSLWAPCSHTPCLSTPPPPSSAAKHLFTSEVFLWHSITWYLRSNSQVGGSPLVGSLLLYFQHIRSYHPYMETVTSIHNPRACATSLLQYCGPAKLTSCMTEWSVFTTALQSQLFVGNTKAWEYTERKFLKKTARKWTAITGTCIIMDASRTNHRLYEGRLKSLWRCGDGLLFEVPP